MPYRRIVDIDAPVAEVWATLIDVERWPDWTPTVERVERLEAGLFRPGSSVRMKQPRLPEAVWRVSGLEPEQFFAWTSRSRGVTSEGRHVLKALDDGRTRALSSLEQSGPLAFLSWLLFSRLIKRYLTRESDGLKKHCEAGRRRP